MSAQDRPLRILMLPDYRRDNPYQALLASALAQLGVTVRFPSGYRRLLPLWRAAREGRSLTDIVHLHWLSPYLKGRNIPIKAAYGAKLLLDLALLRVSGTGLVWTVHNLVAHDSRHPRLNLVLRRAVAHVAQRVIVHDEEAAQRVAAAYRVDRAKIRVQAHGHYRDAYGPPLSQAEARARIGLPPNGRVIASLGLLRPYKQLEQLLEAWRRCPPLAAHHLLIAGRALEPAYAEALVAQARDIPGVRIIPRFLELDEVGATLSAADAVAISARANLTSGAIILAVSYGKPVIAPRYPRLAALLGGAVDLLYDENDPAALCAALEHAVALDDLALARLGEQVRAACDRLAWPPIAEDLRAIYCELASG